MVELDEDAKKKAESDDGSKKKKKEPKKSKKEDGADETNELNGEGKDKKKAKSKKEKSETAPLEESKSPKPKKGKKLSSSDHEVKDDKPTDKKKKDNRESGLDDGADSETALKSDAPAQTKAKKKKGATAETSEEGNGQPESPGEPSSKDATPVQTKPKSKRMKKVVSDDDSLPKSKDTEETVDGETTLKDAPRTTPKIKQRKSKKNLMAESSDDELEIKSDHLKKKKGKKLDVTGRDEETEPKSKVKKGKKNVLADSERESEARQKTKKKHKASELSGENAENTKKKKKKRSSENLEVAASLTGGAPIEPSAQSNETTPILPMFASPTTAGALDYPTKVVPVEEKATNESAKLEVATDNTVDSGSHKRESQLADNDNSPIDLPTIIEMERAGENQSFTAGTEKRADQVIGESTDNRKTNDDPNLIQGVNEVPGQTKPAEEPSTDVVGGDAQTVNDSIVSHHKSALEEDVDNTVITSVAGEETETNANSASRSVDSAKMNALPTSVEAIASGNPESTTGMELGEVLSDGVPSLVTESDHPPALVVENENDGSINQVVPQPATELSSSNEVKESQPDDTQQEDIRLASTTTTGITEAANLEETPNQVQSHEEANPSETAVAAGRMDSLEVPSENNVFVEPHASSGQDVAPKQVDLDQRLDVTNENVESGIQEQSTEMEANVPLTNTNGLETSAHISETKILADSVVHDTTRSIEGAVDHISQDIQVQHTDTQGYGGIDTPQEPEAPKDEMSSRTVLALVETNVIGAHVDGVEKDSLEQPAETAASIALPTVPEPEEIGMPKQTSDQLADDGSQAREAITEMINAQEPNTQGIARDIRQDVEALDPSSVHEVTNAIEVAADADIDDVQGKYLDNQCQTNLLSTTATVVSKSSGDDEIRATELVVAEGRETQTSGTEKVEESLVQAGLAEFTEQIRETVDTKETGDFEPTAVAQAVDVNTVTSLSENPKELLAVCEAMTGLVKNDESSSKEMNRLKEQLLILFGAMHEERISLHARLQKQEAELLKSEEKIEMLEDEMEKQLADWDVLEVKLGQADLEIRKLLAENQRLGNELEVVSKADSLEVVSKTDSLEVVSKADSSGDQSDISAAKQSAKNFSDDIATSKSELEEP